jgi:alpha-L-arabinofuranosidase
MTQPHQYFLNRQMQLALYALKRQYGGPIVIYRLLTSEVDAKTGVASVETLATRIKRAIVLPATFTREVVRNISLISADKQLVQGGGYESGKRVFIIDRRDARNLVISLDDWLVWLGQKYQIEKLEEMEFQTGWIVTGKVLVGETDLELGLQQSIDSGDIVEIDSEAAGDV